jgi:hypothetical protein
MKRLTVLFLFLLLTPLQAQHWTKFLQEDTVLIVHVDLSKIDIAQTIQNNKAIVDAFGVEVPMVTAAAEMGKKYLTDTLGIQEAYFVLNMRMPPTGMAIILPQTGKIKLETLQEAFVMLDPIPWLGAATSKNNEYVLIMPKSPIEGYLAEQDMTRLVDFILPAKPAERADFVEAFKAVEGAPIQIVAAVPDFARRVVKETAPKLPEPFHEVDVVTLLTEIRWAALGIEPAKPAVKLTATTPSDVAAQNVSQTLQKALALIIKTVTEELERLPEVFRKNHEVELVLLKNHKDLILSLLLPKPEGENLVLRWEQAQFDEIVKTMTPLAQAKVAQARANARLMQCSNQMKQLNLAFHNYHDRNGKFPPPFTVDAAGKPLHSWRVLVLPYVDNVRLYEQIRLDEPWDSAHNKQFHDKMPVYFRCPDCTQGKPERDTGYCMVVGKDMIGVPDGKGIRIDQILDGTSNTILLVERKTPVCWMEPTDVLQEHAYLGINKHALGLGSDHPGGCTVGFADASTRFVPETVDIDKLKAVLTKAGGESVWSFP